LIALVIGTMELLHVTVGLRTPDLTGIGCFVVLALVATAAISLFYWKTRRVGLRARRSSLSASPRISG
jgi:hypothetical protein